MTDTIDCFIGLSLLDPFAERGKRGSRRCVQERSDSLLGAFPLSTSFQALLQDRDSCVKALLKAQEKATGESLTSHRLVALTPLLPVICVGVLSSGPGRDSSSTYHSENLWRLGLLSRQLFRLVVEGNRCCYQWSCSLIVPSYSLHKFMHNFRRSSERASRRDGGGHP